MIEISGGRKGGCVTEKKNRQETDYVSSIATMNVEKPVQRTRSETIQRLEELGKNNPDIAAISGSRYVIVFQKMRSFNGKAEYGKNLI